jgi:hypothetical protein
VRRRNKTINQGRILTVSQGANASGGYLVNTAILLLATCMSDAHPITSTSDCNSCGVVSSSCGRCSFWSWFWGKKKECGHHIHCPHPGPIPGMEHPTLKQRIKDRLCPNHCTPPVSRTCDNDCGAVIIQPPTVEPLVMPKIAETQSTGEKIQRMPSGSPIEVPVKYYGPSPY